MKFRLGCKKIFIVMIIGMVLILSACSILPGGGGSKVEGEGFSFSPPPGYTVKEFDDYTDRSMQAQYLIFAQKKPVYFQIFRRELPQGSSLDELFESHLSNQEPPESHYQLISKGESSFMGARAIEYVYAHFHGEPYERTREKWIEHNGMVFILSCSQTISVDKASEPVSPECDRLEEGFSLQE